MCLYIIETNLHVYGFNFYYSFIYLFFYTGMCCTWSYHPLSTLILPPYTCGFSSYCQVVPLLTLSLSLCRHSWQLSVLIVMAMMNTVVVFHRTPLLPLAFTFLLPSLPSCSLGLTAGVVVLWFTTEDSRVAYFQHFDHVF